MKEQTRQMPHPAPEQIKASREPLTRLYAAWPDDLRNRLVEHHLSAWRTGIDETRNFEDEVYEELRTGGGLPDVPMIVMTATGTNPYWAQVMSAELLPPVLAGVVLR